MRRLSWLLTVLTLLLWSALPGRAQGDKPSRSASEVPTAGTLVRDAVRAQEAEDYPKAIRLYRQALKLRPKLGDLWLQLGTLQLAEGKYGDARASLEQAVLHSQDPLPARLALARSYSWEGACRRAEADYRRILAERPYHMEALLGLAAALRGQDRWDQAEAVYGRILDRQPENLVARVALGNLWRDRGHLARADQAYLEALRTDRSDPQARLARSRLHLMRRDLDLAEGELAELLRMHPGDAEGHLARARLARMQGQEARALASLEEARRWAPSSRPVREAWRRYRMDHDPALDPILRRFTDSDGNQFQSLGARLSMDLEPEQRVSFFAEQQHQSNPGRGLATDVTLAMLGWRGRVAPDLAVAAGLGMAALPGGSLPLGSAGLNWTPTLDDSIWINYSSELFTDTPTLVRNRVVLQEAGLQYRHGFTDEDFLEVGYRRGFLSDHNQRDLFHASYFHDFLSQPRLSLGAAFRGFGYDFPSTAGYFSPSSFRLTEAVLRLDNHDLDDPWLYSLEAAVGRQSIAGQPDQTVTRLSASLGYRVTDWLELEAGALTTNSAAASEAGYRFTSEMLRARIRF